MNKIFIVWYNEFPAEPEASVVIAKDKDDAFDLVKDWFNKNKQENSWGEKGDKYKLTLVDKIEDLDYLNMNDDEDKCFIEEVSVDKGVIYTGFYCC